MTCSCAKGRPCKEAKRLWAAVEKVLKPLDCPMDAVDFRGVHAAYEPYRDHIVEAREEKPLTGC